MSLSAKYIDIHKYSIVFYRMNVLPVAEVGVIVIDAGNQIHENIAKFFTDSFGNYQLSDSIGTELLRLNIISPAQTVAEVKADKRLYTFLFNRAGLRWGDTVENSIHGKAFGVSDKDIFYRCQGNIHLNNFVRESLPQLVFNQIEQFRKVVKRLQKQTTDACNSLIEGFPLIDAPDPREPVLKRRRPNVPAAVPIPANIPEVAVAMALDGGFIDNDDVNHADDDDDEEDGEEDGDESDVEDVDDDGFTQSFKAALVLQFPQIFATGVFLKIDNENSMMLNVNNEDSVKYFNDFMVNIVRSNL